MSSLSKRRFFRHIPWLVGPLCCGLLALYLGQDANWDLRNYHFYNPYALLHHRLNFDVLPAQVATFYNPLLYVPFYQAVTHLPPMGVGFLLGALQGLNFPLLIAITLRFMEEDTPAVRRRIFIIALVGLLGAPFISELGTMFSDNLTSLPVLLSLLLLLANFRKLTEPKLSKALLPVVAAGMLAGLAAGLKQPSAVFAVGWCLAFLALPLSFTRRTGLAFVFGVGVLIGIAAGGGYWLHEMWARYGNPLFPYFNRFFHSSMASLSDYRDARFLPRNWFEAWSFPFIIVRDPWHTSESFFRDLRLPLFVLLLIVSAGYALRKKIRRASTFQTCPVETTVALTQDKKRFLFIGGLAAYAAWLKLFAIYRYLMPLEMLLPLGIWLLIDTFPWRKSIKNYAALFCAVLLLVTLHPGNWGRTAWGDDYFGVTAPALADPAHTMVLMTGLDPTAYVIPFFPEPVRFVRIHSYFSDPLSGDTNGFKRLMARLITDHEGPLYVLFRAQTKKQNRSVLQAYGLTVADDDCQVFASHIEATQDSPLLFCAVNKPNENSKNGEINQ